MLKIVQNIVNLNESLDDSVTHTIVRSWWGASPVITEEFVKEVEKNWS